MKIKLLNLSEELIFEKLQLNINTLNNLKNQCNENNGIKKGIEDILNQCKILLKKRENITNTKEILIKKGYLKEILRILTDINCYIYNIKQAIEDYNDLKYIYIHVNKMKEIFNIKGDIILIKYNNFQSQPTFNLDYKELIKDFNVNPVYFIYIDYGLDLYGLPLICHELGHFWIYENNEKNKDLIYNVKNIIGNINDENMIYKIEELTCDMFSAYLFKTSAAYTYLINSFIDFNELTDTHFEDSFRLYMILLECENNDITNDNFLLENRNKSLDFRKYSKNAKNIKKLYDKFLNDLFQDKYYPLESYIEESINNVIKNNIDIKTEIQNLKSKINKV